MELSRFGPRRSRIGAHCIRWGRTENRGQRTEVREQSGRGQSGRGQSGRGGAGSFGTSMGVGQKTWAGSDGVRCWGIMAWDVLPRRKPAPPGGGMCNKWGNFARDLKFSDTFPSEVGTDMRRCVCLVCLAGSRGDRRWKIGDGWSGHGRCGYVHLYIIRLRISREKMNGRTVFLGKVVDPGMRGSWAPAMPNG